MDHGFLLTLSIHLAEIPTSLQNFAYTTPHWDWNENTSWDCVICHSMLDGKEWKIQNLLLQCFCRCLKQAGNNPEGKGQKEREMVDWLDCWCLARWLLWAACCWWERVTKLKNPQLESEASVYYLQAFVFEVYNYVPVKSCFKLYDEAWLFHQVWNVIFDRS